MQSQFATINGAKKSTAIKEKGSAFVKLDGEDYICIRNVDKLSPFLMSIVSDSDHWLYVGSNSPFTAGRVDADHAIFPYQTVDKILRHPDSGGALSIFHVKHGDQWLLWEPWRDGRSYSITRNLYKHIYGASVVFEEINEDLGLCFRWKLTVCEPYGFVRECRLENRQYEPVEVKYLDGWHQILPPGVNQETFAQYSYLAAAYMRHEVLPDSELAVYTLNAGISDRPEPCESLRAACAWSLGHRHPVVLLSSRQVEAFRGGAPAIPELEARGEMGAYLVADSATVSMNRACEWTSVVDTGLDHAALIRVQAELGDVSGIAESLKKAIEANRLSLRRRIGAADGLQCTADENVSVHHFANVLFNCMRGGTFNDSYRFPTEDFAAFVCARNRLVFRRHEQWLDHLAPVQNLAQLHEEAGKQGDVQLQRLAYEYLPITFSRRHGDPSRPWNRFTIHVKDDQGHPLYGYEGNWRDIFQNWEGLAQSYPAFLEQMLTVFLNASTADGYNSYRINRAGVDWETPDPRHPWGNLGYWGDHQIIYLLRLLQSYERFWPGRLAGKLNQNAYCYSHVPYEIQDFEELLLHPRQSIIFNHVLHERLVARAEKIGTDGKLLTEKQGEVLLTSLAEKLLVPLLVKLSNFVPEGGIWLNTQRPEWNDANNALAGWGLSMVTVYHIRRYLTFLEEVISSRSEAVEIHAAVAKLLNEITAILWEAGNKLPNSGSGAAVAPLDPALRFEIMAKLGRAGTTYRRTVYRQGLDGRTTMPIQAIQELIDAALPVIDSSIRANRRPDALYQSYNVLHIRGARALVQNLSLMLEGQVAALSSGCVSPSEAVTLLQALRKSDLYRADERSYMLYPDRTLASFLARNTFSGLPPLQDSSLFVKDKLGQWHFQADICNAVDVNARLDKLGVDPQVRKAVLQLWETTFRHSEFSGRSSTFFAFEGLGSIYWHMVAKLLLAVQECHGQTNESKVALQLGAAFHDIRNGLGFRKTPELYGAFPTDPYSHSPRHRGAQQPGMSGQVKEEILTRWGELGVRVEGGRLRFAPRLLQRSEFFDSGCRFVYVDVQNCEQVWQLPANSVAFTYCQVPICYVLGDAESLVIERADGVSETLDSNTLSATESQSIFSRDGKIRRVIVTIPAANLLP